MLIREISKGDKCLYCASRVFVSTNNSMHTVIDKIIGTSKLGYSARGSKGRGTCGFTKGAISINGSANVALTPKCKI